jgi:hypothetical protein
MKDPARIFLYLREGSAPVSTRLRAIFVRQGCREHCKNNYFWGSHKSQNL